MLTTLRSFGFDRPFTGPGWMAQALPRWQHGVARGLREPAAQALAEGLGRHAIARLVLFAPLFILPAVGTAGDLAGLVLLYVLVLASDALSRQVVLAASEPVHGLDLLPAGLAATVWLAALLLLGAGPGLTLALLLAVRVVELRRAHRWPVAITAAAIAGALMVDLSLVVLASERSLYWLALGAAVGSAFKTAAMLRQARAQVQPQTMPVASLEAVLVTALVLSIGLYAALLAREPVLRDLAWAGGYLTVPLLAAAVLRVALVELGWREAVPPAEIPRPPCSLLPSTLVLRRASEFVPLQGDERSADRDRRHDVARSSPLAKADPGGRSGDAGGWADPASPAMAPATGAASRQPPLDRPTIVLLAAWAIAAVLLLEA